MYETMAGKTSLVFRYGTTISNLSSALDAHCQIVTIILTIRCNVLGEHRYTACSSHPPPHLPPSERLQGSADLSSDFTLQITLSIYFV